MKITFFDCETNGLPIGKPTSMKETKKWPRVTELAWQCIDLNLETSEYQVYAEHAYLIKPNGWTIPKEKFFIDNGFTTENSMANGTDLLPVLELFVFHLSHTDVMVAHNMDFDYNVVGAEMIRHKKTTGRSIAQLCTMKAATPICKIPGKFGGFKWPNLTELHSFLFGKPFEGAHAAGSDVEACKVCLLELVKRKLVIIPQMKAV